MMDSRTFRVQLSNRAHVFAHPDGRVDIIDVFSKVIGCPLPTQVEMPDGQLPILIFEFPNGGSLSIEFVDDALDEVRAGRGAWLEFAVDNPEGLQQRVVAAGLRQVPHSSGGFYFAAPGGQVIRIVSST